MIRVESGKKQVERYSGYQLKSLMVQKRNRRRRKMMKNLTSIKLFSMLANTWRIASWPRTQRYFSDVSARRVQSM